MRKVKTITFFIILTMLFTVPSFTFELGLIGGTIGGGGQTNEGIYGISGGFGFIIPMVKFEVEYYNLNDRRFEAVTGGVKVRKRFGKFAPYAILGGGAEFENLTFKTSEYETFFFIGGGVHVFLIDFLSVRADLRFQTFSEFNKTRFSLGVFFHL